MALPTITNEQLFAFVRKNPVSCGCGLLCVLLGVFYFFRSDTLPEEETALEASSAEAARLALNIKNAAQLKEQNEVLQKALAQVDNRIVRVQALSANLQHFYKIEAETEAKILELHQNPVLPPAKDKKPTLYLAVPYTLRVQGDYARLLRFLREMESGPFYCRVLTAVISPSVAGGLPSSSAAGSEDAPENQLTLSINFELVGLP